MDTNQAIKEIHAAVLAKAKAQCEVEGNNKLTLEISGKIGEYAAQWATAFGNDGKIDDAEEAAINAKFNFIIDTYLPKREGAIVDKAWNGFSVLFVTVFKGVKSYLNEWFNLGLKCLPVCVAAAALLFSGCAYKGGKVVDGTNLAIGMTIPGTEWTINALDYVGGVRVAGNDMTCIVVSNRVKETNSYFGVVSTSRDTEMIARIEPCEQISVAGATDGIIDN